MKLTAREFISKAEEIKASELSVRQRLESIEAQRQSIQSSIDTQRYRLQSLYLELQSLEDDEDDETDNSAEIAAVMDEIIYTEAAIDNYKQQDAKLHREEIEAKSELRSIEQEEQAILDDIQDSAVRTNQNIALISSFGGDYANVSSQASGSFKHNLGQLSQAAQILGGSVAMGSSGGSGGRANCGATAGSKTACGSGSPRNFYESANNQRKSGKSAMGSMGAKSSSSTTTGRGGKDLYSSGSSDGSESHPKKGGGFGSRPSASAKTTPLEALSAYMSKHNYGRDDFAIYSQDPEWRVLQRTAYPNYKMPPMNQKVAFDALNQYMAAHNYGPDDYSTYSKDPVWQELHECAYPTAIGSTSLRTGSYSNNSFGVQSIESINSWIGEINRNPRNDPRRHVNCGRCAAAVYLRLNGDKAATAGLGTYSIEEMNRLTGKKQTPMTPDQIKSYLISQGPGAHVVVGVDRASGDGHWFNAYYDGYQVYTIEGQDGTIGNWPPNYGNVVNWDVSV